MKNKLLIGIVAVVSIALTVSVTKAVQTFSETVIVPSLKVGVEGAGGVTFFNGTIVNETTNDGVGNPVTFGDDVRIDGRVYRGATAGTSDSQPFIVNDNMEVEGSLTVGSTNVLDAINDAGDGDMLQSTYDVAGNNKIDASKLDSGIAATLIGTGTISNTEFGYLNGVSSNIQTQISAKGVGDMLQSTYDVAGNSKIDASKIDSGIDATLIGTGTISNTEFGYLNGVTSNVQTQINVKGVGDMLKSTYDVAGNSKIDAGKLDSGIDATLIGGGGVNNTFFGYLASLNLNNDSDLKLTALGYEAGITIAADGYRNTLVGFQAGDIVTTGDDNTAFGSDALGATITTSDATAVGSSALAVNTAAENTAVGSGALESNTSGINNTAIGFNTLNATITTANNTAVGSNALAANTDTNVTGVGYNALTANTDGNGNTALGSEALTANTTGDYNTAIGRSALEANVLASSNTAIGYNAMAANNSTGNMNVAIGRNALDASTTGTWNVAVGYGTLGNGTGPDSDTAVGHLALASTTGDNNTALGYQAGNGITSGTSNIIIGYDADAPTATASNQMNIGGTIWGDLSNDYIAIGGSAIPTDVILEVIQSGTVPHLNLNPIASAPTTGVDEGDIYMDTDGILYVRSNSAWAAANTAADFSELIVPTDFTKDAGDGVRMYSGKINAGDLIVIDERGNYARSSKPYDSTIVGIESGDRGRFRLKNGTPERAEGQRQIGLVGHVIVNVSLENGQIRPGDSLTSSSLAGHAMKATQPGVVVGKALESFDGSSSYTGKIEVLVDSGWHGGSRSFQESSYNQSFACY
jgi:hypothetical protein